METNYIEEEVGGGVPIKMWTRGVPVEDEAKRQLMNAARLPIVFKHIAAMPDVHFGIGATVGSVIPTIRAIIPAAVGVDIGCGMIACKTNHIQHLGTLGTGNHFIEVCLDEQKFVWFMLHSGSRGVGNFIGTMFIELAKHDAMRNQANLPDRDLAYFEEGSRYFGDYVRAVGWAQKFAAINREVMMKRVIEAAKAVIHKNFQSHIEAVNCHHNMDYRLHKLGQYVRGWTAYFGISQYWRPVPELDDWIRRRIRMCYWKQWRWVRTKIKKLLDLGVSLKTAIQHGVSSKSFWHMARTPALQHAMSNAWLKAQGLASVKDLWCKAQGYAT